MKILTFRLMLLTDRLTNWGTTK